MKSPAAPCNTDITGSREETALKTLICDQTNPKLSRMNEIQNRMAEGPGTHASRSLKRTARRAKSYSPYARTRIQETRCNKQATNDDGDNLARIVSPLCTDSSDVIAASSVISSDVGDSPLSHGSSATEI